LRKTKKEKGEKREKEKEGKEKKKEEGKERLHMILCTRFVEIIILNILFWENFSFKGAVVKNTLWLRMYYISVKI
jgi:hypothetical protein